MKVEIGYHGMGKIGDQCLVRVGIDGHWLVMVGVIGHFVEVEEEEEEEEVVGYLVVVGEFVGVGG